MPWTCLDCGQHDQFKQVVHGYTRWSETHITDNRGDYEECEDHEDYEGETTDQDDLKCIKCDSKHCDDVETNDINWKHLDKKGKWHIGELDEKDRDPKWRNLMVLEVI